MTKALNKARWLKQTLLLLAFLALAVPKASSWNDYRIHYDTPDGWKDTEKLVWDGTEKCYKGKVYATQGKDFLIKTNNDYWGLNSVDWRSYLELALDTWYWNDGNKNLSKNSNKNFRFPTSGIIEIKVTLQNENSNESDPKDIILSSSSFIYSIKSWDNSDNPESVELTKNGDKYTGSLALKANDGFGLPLNWYTTTDQKAGWYKHSGDGNVSTSAIQDYPLVIDGTSDSNNFKAQTAGDYGFELTVDANGFPTSVRITPPNVTPPTPTTHTYYLKGSFIRNWSSNEITATDGVYGIDFTVPESDSEKAFVIKMDDTEYSPASGTATPVVLGQDMNIGPHVAYQNFTIPAGEYHLQLTLGADGVPASIKVTSTSTPPTPSNPYSYYFGSDAESWDGVQMTNISGNKVTYTKDFGSKTEVNFGIRVKEGSTQEGWYWQKDGNSTAVTDGTFNLVKESGSNGSNFKLSIPTGTTGDYTFIITLGDDYLPTQIQIIKPKSVSYYLEASFNEGGWDSPVEITKSGSAYTHEFRVSATDEDKAFAIKMVDADNNVREYGPASQTATEVILGEDMELETLVTDQNFTIPAGTYILTLALDSNGVPTSINVTKKVVPLVADLPFQPRVVRLAKGNWDAWEDGDPVIFLTGDYLNNNTLNPGFEFEQVSATRWRLQNVTLRGAGTFENKDCQQWGDAKIYPKLTAKIYYRGSNTPDQVEGTPSATDLERKNGLTYGRSFNVYLDKEGSSWTLSFELIPGSRNVIPYMALVSQNFTQLVPGKTPGHSANSKATDLGWQESFVYYDKAGNPVRDKDGKYIYSFRWPADGKNYYYSTIKDNSNNVIKELELLDQNITFRYDSKNGVMTGSEWQEHYQGNSQYNALFNSSGDGVYTLNSDVYYARYYIPQAWVLGYTKIWTGWTGQRVGENAAVWSFHANWGYIGSGHTTDDGKGSTITKGTPYGVLGFGGNMAFTEPTYFKYVEMYIPINKTGNNDGAVDADAPYYSNYNFNFNSTTDPIFFTVESSAEIEARAAKSDDSFDENNIGQYQPSYTPSVANTNGYTFRIIRFNADADYDSDDYNTWDRFDVGGDNGDVTIPNGLTLATLDGNTTWYSDKELPNGHFFYGIFIYDSNGEVADFASSNPFTIARVNMPPSIKVRQLLELTEEGARILNDNSNRNYFTWSTDHLWYLTYNPSSTGNFYLVNGADNLLTEVEREDALAAIDAHEVYWTTRYFVNAGNINTYDATMLKSVDAKLISEEYGRPSYNFNYKGTDNTVHTVNNDEMAVSDGLIGYITNYTDGSLDRFTFTSNLSYDYTPIDADGNNLAPQTGGGTAQASPRAYVPGAYDLTYAYSSEFNTDGGAAFAEGTELVTTSSVVASSGEPIMTLTEGVPGENDTPAKKRLRVASLPHRQLDCTFEFKRPNVSTKILKNYDIYYDLLFDNNDELYDAMEDVWCYDNTTDIAQGEKKYQVIASKVNPKAEVWPKFYIKGTVYMKHDENASRPTYAQLDEQRDDTEGINESDYQMYHTSQYEKPAGGIETKSGSTYYGPVLGCEAMNIPATTEMTVATSHEIKKNIDMIGGKRYLIFWIDNVAGNLNFDDNGDFVHYDEDDQGNVTEVHLTPLYYDVEAYMPSKLTNPTFSGPVDDQNWIENQTGYYDCGELLISSTEQPYRLVGNSNYIGLFEIPDNATDEEIWGENGYANENVTFVFTPVYIFLREPKPEAQKPAQVKEDDMIGLHVLEAPEPSPAPAMNNGPHRAAEGQSTEVNDKEYVVVRGGAGSLPIANNNSLWTSVPGISAAAADSEAEYYNLQGLRVENPEKGQVYIVKRDGKATRELLK